jgi:hypothetical protein
MRSLRHWMHQEDFQTYWHAGRPEPQITIGIFELNAFAFFELNAFAVTLWLSYTNNFT